ncbi:MAG: OsmC family protein [Ignavibacteria bacterium]|nr:OsmC family protein [Ignavibacteria bacterium]
MKHSINAEYKSGMAFDIDVMGHNVRVDASPEHGGTGSGPSPKPLMLAALAGCTGMDVVSMLDKMNIKFDEFSVKVDGETAEEHPKKYLRMNAAYRFKGKNIPHDKVEYAVKLSIEKYCGVMAVYKESVEMSHSIEITE